MTDKDLTERSVFKQKTYVTAVLVTFPQKEAYPSTRAAGVMVGKPKDPAWAPLQTKQ